MGKSARSAILGKSAGNGRRLVYPMAEALSYCWDLGLRHLLPCGEKSMKTKA